MTGILLLTGAALVALALCYVLVQSYRRATRCTGGVSRKISRNAEPYTGQSLVHPFAEVWDTLDSASRAKRRARGTAPGKSRRRWFVPPRS